MELSYLTEVWFDRRTGSVVMVFGPLLWLNTHWCNSRISKVNNRSKLLLRATTDAISRCHSRKCPSGRYYLSPANLSSNPTLTLFYGSTSALSCSDYWYFFDDEWHTLSNSEHAPWSVSAAKAHICSTQFTLDIHFKPMVTSENWKWLPSEILARW